MRRTPASVRARHHERLTALERANPAWAPWFGLWRAADRAEANARRLDVTLATDRPRDAPLMHGATVHADARVVERLLTDLARAASVSWSDSGDPLPLLEAALRGHGRDTGDEALSAVLQFVVPLVLAGASRLTQQMPSPWSHGYCPACGAWPLRVELRGVERERHLRCGRCAADWRGSWLCCSYCGEKDHHLLGLLSPEGQLESRRVETCASCRRYLKAFAALAPADPLEMLLDDVETLELDLAARERGFSRPDALGFSIDVRVLPC